MTASTENLAAAEPEPVFAALWEGDDIEPDLWSTGTARLNQLDTESKAWLLRLTVEAAAAGRHFAGGHRTSRRYWLTSGLVTLAAAGGTNDDDLIRELVADVVDDYPAVHGITAGAAVGMLDWVQAEHFAVAAETCVAGRGGHLDNDPELYEAARSPEPALPGWQGWESELAAAGWKQTRRRGCGSSWSLPGASAFVGRNSPTIRVACRYDFPDIPFAVPLIDDPDYAPYLRAGADGYSDESVILRPLQFRAGAYHDGDIFEAVDTQLAAHSIATSQPPADNADPPAAGLDLVDWTELYAGVTHEDAIIDGVAIRGRWTALVAPGKAGKSTYTIALATSKARGIDPFTGTACDPAVVLYLDAEMGRVDLLERLEELALNPADLGRLHYTDLVPKLDTVEGAAKLVPSSSNSASDSSSSTASTAQSKAPRTTTPPGVRSTTGPSPR